LSSKAPALDWPIEIVCVLTVFKCGGYHSVRYATPDDFPDFNAFLVRYEEMVALQCRMNGAALCILPDGPCPVILVVREVEPPDQGSNHGFEAKFEQNV
jgi:hypothetical protein